MKKEETEYTGLESHVREKLDFKDITWFPQQKAISVKDIDESHEKKLLERIEQIEETLLVITRKIWGFVK